MFVSQIFKKLLRVKCICYGISGSCDMKTCWRKAPTVEEVAREVYRRYFTALQTKKQFLHRSRTRPGVQLTYREETRIPKRDQLVYMRDSPDFCEAQPSYGLPGTVGRQCQETFTREEGSCYSMCCGSGYDSEEQVETVCDCHHVFCCRRVCTNCRKVVKTIHRCNGL